MSCASIALQSSRVVARCYLAGTIETRCQGVDVLAVPMLRNSGIGASAACSQRFHASSKHTALFMSDSDEASGALEGKGLAGWCVVMLLAVVQCVCCLNADMAMVGPCCKAESIFSPY